MSSTPTTTKRSTALGDILPIDDRTVLVLGQELDVPNDQPDVANALLHRAGDTLFLVDTGVTEQFRRALRTAVDRVGEWQRLVVLTTHGHPDHVGNNDLGDELAAERTVPVEHYVPARDVPQMLDPATYWIRSFTRIVEVAPLPAPPKLAGSKIVSLFQPLRPFGATTRTYEELPLERVTLGSVRLTGWSFADGAVQVLRSQGHCAGHVIVFLRDSRVLHLADEGNGACGAMYDADQLKLQTVIGAVATLFDEGLADTLSDGHTFAVRRRDEAVSYLDRLLDQAMALQQVALSATAGRASMTAGEFAAAYGRGIAELDVSGANPNPMFTGMMAVNQLGEIGLRPEGSATDAPWSRPTLVNPAPVAGMPRGLALVPAAVAMLRWKLGKRSR
jgi:glyoxylase-like metal-dependent hydrolase (beta-lactamase superfamily II)